MPRAGSQSSQHAFTSLKAVKTKPRQMLEEHCHGKEISLEKTEGILNVELCGLRNYVFQGFS